MKRFLICCGLCLSCMLFADAKDGGAAQSKPVFELNLKDGKDNWTGYANHRKRLKVRTRICEGAAASVVSSAHPEKKEVEDTGFGLTTPFFDVTGRKQVLVEGSAFSTISILNAKGCQVLWLDAQKKNLPPTSFCLPWKKGAYSDFSLTIAVPAGAVKGQVWIGYDNPNYVHNDFFAVKALKVSVR